MLSTVSRQRAETAIRGAAASGERPWAALDAYRRRGGRIRWNDWFRLWKQIAQPPAAHGERLSTAPCAGLHRPS